MIILCEKPQPSSGLSINTHPDYYAFIAAKSVKEAQSEVLLEKTLAIASPASQRKQIGKDLFHMR